MIAYAGSEPPAPHLNASQLMELYSSMYSSIHNMSVSYTDVVEEIIPDPNAPDAFKNLIRYQKVERIEEGDKYYIRYSFSTDPNGFGKGYERLNGASFDGSVTMEYNSRSRRKSGSIYPGRTGKSYENTNLLPDYMLMNKIFIVHKEMNKFPDGIPFINFSLDPQEKVRPHLEQISGQWCHVVETNRPPLPGEPKGGGTTIWFAADKGGLPMKFEEHDGYGKCTESIFVEKVATVDDKVSNVWYPQEATRTISNVRGTRKHRFVCHELRINIETNEDTWKVSFPEGTGVVDRVSGITYNAGPSENTEGNP
jgi:hypothetical protein